MICPFLYLNAQTNFNNGYQKGWKEGYCHNYGSPSCIPPIPPISPIPLIGEDVDNYKDGYNRGFADGLDSFKKSSDKSSTRERYKTSDFDTSNNFMYEPDWGLMMRALEAQEAKRKRILEENRKTINDVTQKIRDLIINSELPSDDKQKIWENINENCIQLSNYNNFHNCLITQVNNQLEIIKRRGTREEIRKHSTEEKQEESEKNDIKYYEKIHTGDVRVNSYAPIHKEPDMFSEEIYRVPFNNKVSIIERVKDGKYYKVKSNGKEGYIWAVFIIE